MEKDDFCEEQTEDSPAKAAAPDSADASPIPEKPRHPIIDFPGDISPSATLLNLKACADLAAYAINTHYEPQESPWVQDENIFVVGSEGSPFVAGAFLTLGLIEMNFKKLKDKTPEYIRRVLLHERAHLHIQSQVRQHLIGKHRDIDDFFHNTVLMDWLNGDLQIRSSKLYLYLKFINPLREDDPPSADSPFDAGFPKATNISTIDNYLSLLRKGLIRVEGKTIFPHDITPRHKEWKTLLDSAPDVPLKQLYEKDKEGFTTALATIYHFALGLQSEYAAYIGEKCGLNMDLLEEAFCHYIGAVGAQMEDIPADINESQRRLAQLILEKKYPAFEALQEVRSPQDLVFFLRKIGCIAI